MQTLTWQCHTPAGRAGSHQAPTALHLPALGFVGMLLLLLPYGSARLTHLLQHIPALLTRAFVLIRAAFSHGSAFLPCFTTREPAIIPTWVP